MGDVAPKPDADKALPFRVFIAAHPATVVAGELRTAHVRFGSRAQRLAALLGAATTPATESDLDAANRALATTRRRGTALEHLVATARKTLELTAPRFEPGEELQGFSRSRTR